MIQSASHDACANLATLFFDQAETFGEKPFLWAKGADGAYHARTWREAAAEVSALARGLRELGLKPGDRVALISENRPEWPIAELAIMTAGAIAVPAYVTNTESDHLHILDNSGAKFAIVSTRKLAERLFPAALQAEGLTTIIAIEDPDLKQSIGVDVTTWRDVIDKGEHAHGNVVDWAGELQRTDTAIIIYTSGTGGLPKGVMLSHGAILHNCVGARDALAELGLGNDVFLSFLPLSHSYEHMAGQFFPIFVGAEIYYAEGIESLGANMVEARPTIMTAVPRLYETMHARILRGVEKTGGLKAKLFMKALELGQKRFNDPKSLSLGERVLDLILDKLVRNKVRARFGGRLKALVSGGAPLNPDIGLFFTALGLRILQGYGQTESAPLISVNMPSDVRVDSVGPPVTATEVRIADDGEILARGELVMQGYWRDPDATARTIRDGWLHTGDIGTIDDDGHLRITDRKKDIIVNSGGDNIAPQRIEGLLTLEAEIAQAMVIGDKRPHLVGLIVPDATWLADWAAANGKDAKAADIADDPDLQAAIGDAVRRVNQDLSNIEKVRKFIITMDGFSIDNEMMTPTMKIRRHIIVKVYGERLNALYA